MLQDLIQDLRIGLRGLLRARLLTLTIVATVGLGIGATTVIFGAVNAPLLRPLPYADPGPARPDLHGCAAEQISVLGRRLSGARGRSRRSSSDRRLHRAGDGVQRRQSGRAADRGRIVSWTYFGLLGITPALGRDFTEADGRPGSPRTVIVSQSFWQQRLGGRVDAIGKPVRHSMASDYTLTGVLPPTIGPLERGAALLHRRAVADADAQGSVLHHRARPPAAADREPRIAPRPTSCARSTGGCFQIWKSLVSGRPRDVEHDRSEDITSSATSQPVGGLALAAVGARVADRLHERVEPADRARHQPAPRAGGARPRSAPRADASSATCSPRARCSRSAPPPSASRSRGRASACCASWPPTTSRASQEIALDGTGAGCCVGADARRAALLFGLVPALHGTGGPVDESLRASGRSSTGTVGVRRLRRILVGSRSSPSRRRCSSSPACCW